MAHPRLYESEPCPHCGVAHEQLAEYECSACGLVLCEAQARGEGRASYHYVLRRGESVPCGPLEEGWN